MIELIWIAIAALGSAIAVVVVWNVFYIGPKLRGFATAKPVEQPQASSLEWMRATTAAMDKMNGLLATESARISGVHGSIMTLHDAIQIETGNRENSDDDIKAETAKREALEEMIGKYIATPQPVMLDMEAIYQAMCNRAAMEHDPDFIIRSRQKGGGCGDH